jgi:hypothetical protein
MERFHNAAFALLHTMLGYQQAKNEAIDSQKLTQVIREVHLAMAKILEGYFLVNHALAIPFTRVAGERAIASLKDENCALTVQQTLNTVDEVFNRLWDEIEEGGHFFYIPIKRANAFDTKEPFGPEVSAKFPKLGEDIEEAHKCYACGRNTACVFHLMRVMEVAVQRLGQKLKIKNVKNLVWQVILDQINGAIKALPPKSAKTKKLAAVAGHLYNVKLAWRNEVMHPKATYTQDEAETLLALVKIFMAEAASCL